MSASAVIETGFSAGGVRGGAEACVCAICVCACTYRRPEGLAALLEGLRRQKFSSLPRPAMHIVIADNEGSPRTREICERFREQSGIPLTYVHEPERGISFARNACLDNIPPECDFFAFIDDDEVPAPDWLDQLALAQARTDADVVRGIVEPLFYQPAPEWIRSGRYFGIPRRIYDLDCPQYKDLEDSETASTGNVLVRTSKVRESDLKFDISLGLSGGEDTFFFNMMTNAGCRIVRSRQAIVYENIPPDKANFYYMFRERFRIGNTDALLRKKLAGKPLVGLMVSSGTMHVWLGAKRIAKTVFSRQKQRDRFAVGAFHIAYGTGMIAAACGFRYQHYR